MRSPLARLRSTLLGTAIACSVAVAPAAADTMVVGGHDTSASTWPSVAFLDGLAYSCTGTLIDPSWVLTAGHCVAATAPAGPIFPAVHITATVGADAPYGSGGKSGQVLLAYTHPNYGLGHEYDVALLKLASPITGVPTIKLTGTTEGALYAGGTTATIVGYGDTSEGGSPASVIQEASLPVVDDATCSNLVDPYGYNAALMLCAGYVGVGGVDTCQGDSGGPLFVPLSGGGFRQAGVTSFGNGCARPNDPGAYTELGSPEISSFIAGYVPGAIGSGGTPARSAKPAVAAKKKAAHKKSRKRARRASRR
jgi:secreted trypsin-like serine protease